MEIRFFWALNTHFYRVHPFAESDTLAIHIRNIHNSAPESRWNKTRQQIMCAACIQAADLVLRDKKSINRPAITRHFHPQAVTSQTAKPTRADWPTCIGREAPDQGPLARHINVRDYGKKRFSGRVALKGRSTNWVRFN